MSAVREHHCGGWTYELTGPDGQRLVLDAAAGDGPGWAPGPDGRTAERVAEFGHAEHRCVPEGQGLLL